MKQKLLHCQYGVKSNKQLYPKQHTTSSGSTDYSEDLMSAQHKLKTLQQRQKAMAEHYSSKISQLQDILAKQISTKNELTKELVTLSIESQEQQDYLGKLKIACIGSPSPQKPAKSREVNLIASDYMIQPKNIRQEAKRSRMKGGLLASGKLSWSLQKCKSQSNLRLRLGKYRDEVSSKFAGENDYHVIS